MKCGNFEFHVANASYDLNYDLVCFSNTAIQFLKNEIRNQSSPLWNMSEGCDKTLEGANQIPYLLSIFKGNDCDVPKSLHNVQNLRHLLMDLLDEKTLNFLSEVFPVANGVAFPMVAKQKMECYQNSSVPAIDEDIDPLTAAQMISGDASGVHPRNSAAKTIVSNLMYREFGPKKKCS